MLSDLAWNTFRDHLILEYEIPKFDGDLGHAQLLRAARSRYLPRKDTARCSRRSARSATSTGSLTKPSWL